MRRALTTIAAVAATLMLGGCTPSLWSGTVTFHHTRHDGEPAAGEWTDEYTTYTAVPGHTLATVTSTYDAWDTDYDVGFTTSDGCWGDTIHWRGERTTVGYINVVGNGLVAGLAPYGSSTQFDVTGELLDTARELSCPMDVQRIGIIASRDAAAPEVLTGATETGFAYAQDDCPDVAYDVCDVIYDVARYVR